MTKSKNIKKAAPIIAVLFVAVITIASYDDYWIECYRVDDDTGKLFCEDHFWQCYEKWEEAPPPPPLECPD
jgi:hypothetical protein